MLLQITVKYSAALIKTTTARFWLKFIGWDGFLAFGILAAISAYLVYIGDRSWQVGLFGGLLLICVVLAATIYLTYLRRSMAVFKQMPNPTATFTFDQTGLSYITDVGSSQLKWTAIVKIWRFPEAWLLFVSKGMYITLPVDGLTDDIQQLIIAKITENKINIV